MGAANDYFHYGLIWWLLSYLTVWSKKRSKDTKMTDWHHDFMKPMWALKIACFVWSTFKKPKDIQFTHIQQRKAAEVLKEDDVCRKTLTITYELVILCQMTQMFKSTKCSALKAL